MYSSTIKQIVGGLNKPVIGTFSLLHGKGFSLKEYNHNIIHFNIPNTKAPDTMLKQNLCQNVSISNKKQLF